MKFETVERKCGYFGMLCILGSIALGLLISLGALVALVICVGKCIF